MTSSSCKFLLRSWLVVACCLIGSAGAQTPVPRATPAPAATPVPAPPATPEPAPVASGTPRESKAKHGWLRFWNVLPKESGEFMLIKENGTPEGDTLLSAAPENFYASYIKLPIGKYNLKMVRREAPATVIQYVDFTLKGDDSFTLLVSAPDRKLKVETIDETYSLADAPAGRLTIRHHFPGARINVIVGAQTKSHDLSPGDTEVLENLPLRAVEVKTQAALPGGKVESWSTEVNFQNLRHATLLVVPDPYGRFRPRIAIEGVPAPAPPPAAAAR